MAYLSSDQLHFKCSYSRVAGANHIGQHNSSRHLTQPTVLVFFLTVESNQHPCRGEGKK